MTVTDDRPATSPDTRTAATPPTFVSYSSLTTHRKCPQAWQYGYVQRLAPISEADTIDRDLGSWWHAIRALDGIQRGIQRQTLVSLPGEIGLGDLGPTLVLQRSTWQSKRQAVYKLGDKSYPADPRLVIAVAKAWWRRMGNDLRDAWMDRFGGVELADHLAGMDQRWTDRWRDDLKQEEPIAIELDFRRQLPGLDVTLGGRIDEVYRDRKRGLIIARDHKSNRSLGSEVLDDFMDSQLHLYSWGASPAVQELIGRGIQAVAYDRARSVPPKDPQVTQSGTLSKSVTDYDLQTYLHWCEGPDGNGQPYPGRKKDGSGAGFYQAEESVIAKLSTPQAREVWNHRTVVPLNPNVIRAHLDAAVDTTRDMFLSVDRLNTQGAAPRNLTRFGCGRCDFADLCRAQMIGGPDGDYDLESYGLRVKD